MIAFTINWEGSIGVCCKFCGVLSVQDIYHMLKEMGDDPRFDSIEYRIMDYLSTSGVDTQCYDEMVEILLLAVSQRRRNPQHLIAMVGTHPEFLRLWRYWEMVGIHPEFLKLWRYWESINSDYEHTCLFANVPDARGWIDNYPIM